MYKILSVLLVLTISTIVAFGQPTHTLNTKDCMCGCGMEIVHCQCCSIDPCKRP